VSDKPQWVQNVPLMDAATQRNTDQLYRRRIRSLQAVDDGIASLVDTLRRTGQLANTYLVFTSDNGFHLGQHRLPAGKQTAYETDIHLPLIVRGPGVPAGRTASQIVGNIDLAPTFAALAKAKAPGFVDGRSFASLLHHPAGAAPWRSSYLVEHWKETNAATARGAATLEPADADQTAATTIRTSASDRRASRAALADRIPEFHGMRTGRFLYVEYVTGERELYDVLRDPEELHNLSKSAPPALLARFHDQLGLLKSCRSTRCRSAENQPAPR
jgi:arylsulfatase A-like enzyme